MPELGIQLSSQTDMLSPVPTLLIKPLARASLLASAAVCRQVSCGGWSPQLGSYSLFLFPPILLSSLALPVHGSGGWGG
jgi:hypothetical protein